MFSLYYQIANALLRGRASVTEYNDKAVHDPKVLELCKKVQLKITPEYERPGTFNKTRLEIVTKRGTFSQDMSTRRVIPRTP